MALGIKLRISVFKFGPGQHLGEAEEDPGRKGVSCRTAVEADTETAAPTVETVGDHVIVVNAIVHNVCELGG